VLELSGHIVRVAYDGPSGIEVAREFTPEFVLCDIGLPGDVDGYAVAQTLRSDDKLRTACLIAITGYGRPEDEQRARQAGFNEHLTKPVDVIALAKVISDRMDCGLVEQN
jgi:CheY-like chemotaxis protein